MPRPYNKYKRNKEPKQLSLLDEKLEAPIVKAADRYIELLDEKQRIKERLEIQERNLIGLMHKAGKAKIRHGGRDIEIKMEATEKIKVSEAHLAAKKGDA
jgi:hypothetical protein